jgi:hypothetical protein
VCVPVRVCVCVCVCARARACSYECAWVHCRIYVSLIYIACNGICCATHKRTHKRHARVSTRTYTHIHTLLSLSLFLSLSLSLSHTHTRAHSHSCGYTSGHYRHASAG